MIGQLSGRLSGDFCNFLQPESDVKEFSAGGGRGFNDGREFGRSPCSEWCCERDRGRL